MDLNIPVRILKKRCPGHGTKKHATLQGEMASRSAVYTRHLCAGIVQDITQWLRRFDPPPQMRKTDYWECHLPIRGQTLLSCSRILASALLPEFRTGKFMFYANQSMTM